MRSRSSSGSLLSISALSAVAVAAVCIGTATSVHAATIASDNAGNYAGTGGTANVWLNTSNSPATATEPNAGTGFGAWTVVNQQTGASPYNGSGLTTFNSSNPIRTNGNYWYMYANNGTNGASTNVARADAYRAFTGDLSANQAFSVALQSGSVGSYPAAGMPAFGFSLDNGAPTLSVGSVPVTVGNGSQTTANTYVDSSAVFSLSFNELGDSTTSNNLTSYNGQTSSGGYVLETNVTTDGATVSSTSGITSADLAAGITASFDLGTGNAYKLTLSSVGTAPQVLATYTGTLNSSDVIAGADVFNQNTDQNGSFNSLAIAATPEPTSVALLGIAAGSLLLLRRRKMV